MEIVIKVDGMHCEHCKASVEKALMSVNGVVSAQADLKKKTALVTVLDGTTQASLIDAVNAAGFKASAKG